MAEAPTIDAPVLAEVRATLFAPERSLPSKYFYDARGSELFERITGLPEYYLTRAEREILVRRANGIVQRTNAVSLVELGAGSASKTRLLIDALTAERRRAVYVPVDVSAEFLDLTARALESDYESLTVIPTVADMESELAIPNDLPRPVLFALLGSTIGNFEGASAVALLRRLRTQMQSGDALLLGTDLKKDPAVLHAAYNDSAGVTAEFNRNILRVLNVGLGADFVPERFAHRAFFNAESSRIEMHLDSVGDQVIHFPHLPPLILRDGESIRTEVSCKYDRAAVEALATSASLEIDEWFTDHAGLFALSLLKPC
jgi:L-histidine N-alpha-methyltransferase